MADVGNVNSGPIPGANMTADTQNAPWRRAPKFSDVDSAMDFISDKLTQFKVANGFLTMSEIGIPIVKQTQLFLMQGMSVGYWTFDYCLLLAGPTARMIELLHIGFHIPYVMGYEEDPNDFNTGTFFRGAQAVKTIPGSGMKVLKDQMSEVKSAADELPTDPQGQDAEPDQGASGGGAAPPSQSPDLMQQGFMAMTSAPTDTKKGK